MPVPGRLVCFLDERDFTKENDGMEAMLVGGYILSKSKMAELDQYVAETKRRHHLAVTDEIKWGMRGPRLIEVKKKLDAKGIASLRSNMLRAGDKIPIQIIMSFVWKGDKGYTVEAWKWAFTNILQRLCIDLDRKRQKCELEYPKDYPFLDVVFDWLPGTKPGTEKKLEEYFGVYQEAYRRGYNFQKNILNPLTEFKVNPALLVTSTRCSLALQLTDFFVGATADFFIWCFAEESSKRAERLPRVKRYFSSFYNAFRKGDKGEVLGCGLIVKHTSKQTVTTRLGQLGLPS